MYECKVLADSVSIAGFRITTLQVTAPRIILAEANTHRVFSRNSASSRAVPVEKRIRMIELDPFVPVTFGKNQKGMQAEETLADNEAREAEAWWNRSMWDAIRNARHLADAGVHKQLANRVIEPYAWHTMIITSTEWENFDNLRISKHAQPEIRTMAEMMKKARDESEPRTLADGEWHLPLVRGVDEFDLIAADFSPDQLAKISCARCARVSYLTHDGERAPEKDVDKADELRRNGHMSPFEHAARPMSEDELELFTQVEFRWQVGNGPGLPLGGAWAATGRTRHFLGNVEGWVQYRKQLPGEAIYQEPA